MFPPARPTVRLTIATATHTNITDIRKIKVPMDPCFGEEHSSLPMKENTCLPYGKARQRILQIPITDLGLVLRANVRVGFRVSHRLLDGSGLVGT